jgi:hypothetical protein
MSNFKSGSGNLDFGGDDEDDAEADTTTTPGQPQTEDQEAAESAAPDESATPPSDSTPAETPSTANQPESDQKSAEASTTSAHTAQQYPYFVRRNNVGDERDTRLEIHVRDKVADQEGAFRNELADQLGVNEVSKTDAREFALLAAFHNPEQVAELMRDEGFGTLG